MRSVIGLGTYFQIGSFNCIHCLSKGFSIDSLVIWLVRFFHTLCGNVYVMIMLEQFLK